MSNTSPKSVAVVADRFNSRGKTTAQVEMFFSKIGSSDDVFVHIGRSSFRIDSEQWRQLLRGLG